MKLRELRVVEAVDEDKFYDWWDANIAPERGSIHKPYADYENGIVKATNTEHSRARLIFNNKARWNPPVDSNDWDTETIRDIYLEQYSLQNFDKVPNVEFIELISVLLDSFRGIEKLTNLEHFRMHRYRGYDSLSKSLPKNILRLYKNPKLHTVDLDNLYPAKMLDIFHKHFDERNIVDCIDELIEAGYKEYAKL